MLSPGEEKEGGDIKGYPTKVPSVQQQQSPDPHTCVGHRVTARSVWSVGSPCTARRRVFGCGNHLGISIGPSACWSHGI